MDQSGATEQWSFNHANEGEINLTVDETAS
jgi:hypothetical protein